MWNGTSMISHNEVSSTTLPEVTTSETAFTTPDAATYIEQHLGVQHLPYNTIIPISVVYAIIFVVGVLGMVSNKKSILTMAAVALFVTKVVFLLNNSLTMQ